MMRSKGRTTAIAALLAVMVQAGWPIQTGRVDLGVNGAYDGTVWIARSTTGSLVFGDQDSGTSVPLQELREGRNDHGTLSGLGDDDHPQYYNATRHTQGHTATFNGDLSIPADVGNNVTLGGHVSDGNIHVRKDDVETISGAWRFTGIPAFEGSFIVDPTAPGNTAAIDFGTSASPPQILYRSDWDVFEFSRPLQATSGSLTELEAGHVRVDTNLNGRNELGQPAATLSDFVSINGIAASDLLDSSANEDIAGQWDFLADMRVFGDLECADCTASGVLRTAGIELTTATEETEVAGTFSHLETTSPVLKLVLDRDDHEAGYKRFQLWAGDRATHAAWEFVQDGDAGMLRFKRESDGFAYLQMDVDSNGASLARGPYNGVYARWNGDVWAKLNSADGSDLFRIRDSADADQWTCNSDGDVAMVADARQTIPDGTDGPFILTFNAATNYYPDANESLAPTARALTGLDYQGAGTSYVAFPVGNDALGANVVLDRIMLYCSQVGGTGVQISAIALVDDTNTAVRTYSSTVTGDVQWLTSDYTMDDGKSYVVRLTFTQNSSGSMRLVRFKVEYHLE